MGEAAPKPKASARKKKGDSASFTTPPTLTPTTIVESALRLSATAKGKQPSRATTPVEPTDIQRTKAKQLKIVLKKEQTRDAHLSTKWFRLKKDQEKDKIGSKRDKNGKRGEAGKGTVEDKILVPKPSKNCARCTRCGYLVDGPNCQGCALLRQELEENLVATFPDFQNTPEPSNASTNVVNALREPNVVKQDNGSFVDKIIFRAPDSPDQFHCFHCKAVLRAGEACKRCTCTKCGSRISKGLCYICGHNQNS
nr:hypothetical protein [Tanacetum cinerariifolium]